MNTRTAIVTGTSRIQGIGRAICLELARQGCDIFFTYWKAYDHQMPWGVNNDEPDIIQEEIKKCGVRCEKIELDLSEADSIEILFNQVEQQLEGASILVNNATYSTSNSIHDISSEELDQHYLINVKATTLLTSEFVKRFKLNKGGRIINLTSGQSLGKMPNEIAYAMTKSAIETLTTAISSEIAAQGITINAVNPGPTDTGWMDDTLKSDLLDRFPMGKIGSPEHAAQLIGYLVKEEAEWITGQIIHSEGGFIR